MAWPGWACVLSDIGAPNTSQNISFLETWAQYEGVEPSANNPLATEQGGPGCTPTYNSAGVQECATWQDGCGITSKTLTNGYYPAIVAALITGNPWAQVSPQMISEINTWGTHGFANHLSGGGGAQSAGSSQSSPSQNGWLNSIEQGLLGPLGAAAGLSGIAGGIFQDAEDWLQQLFNGFVSPFLRLPQSLINIGWNFGGFVIGCGLIALGALLLFGAIFEEGFDKLADAFSSNGSSGDEDSFAAQTTQMKARHAQERITERNAFGGVEKDTVKRQRNELANLKDSRIAEAAEVAG